MLIEIVNHDFKIIDIRFESARTIKLITVEAKMCFLNIFLYALKAI